MKTMKAVRIRRFGGPDVIEIEDIPIPQPGNDEVLLRVHAASVNPVDYKTRQGSYPPIGEDQLPIVLGRDVAGTVETLGTAVDSFKVGDSVYALLAPERGSFAEYVLVRSDEATPRPERINHKQAAAVPLAALTAWQALFDHGGLQPDQRVLIHGGAGGVGHFAIQLAKAKGATVLTTVSSKDLDFAGEVGADQAIDYTAQGFEQQVGNLDLVLDLVGGETQDRSWQVLKAGGVLVSTLGEPSQDKAAKHEARGLGFMVQPNAAQLAEIGDLIEDGKVKPFIQATYPFEQARSAQERQESGHVQGKLVLNIAEGGR